MSSSSPLRSLGAAFVLCVMVSACRDKSGTTVKPAGSGGSGGFAIQVVAVPVRQEPVIESVGLVGSVAANEFVEIKAESDGTVQEIAFSEGKRVEKGALLVLLDETKAQASLGEAEATHRLSVTKHERSQQMLKERLISQQEYDQAIATLSMSEATIAMRQRSLRDMRVLAPFTGLTGARQISPGQVISRNTLLTSLVDLDTVKIEVSIPERYLSEVKPGLVLDFKVAAFPSEVFHGEVYFISPQLDATTRTALVKAKVANPLQKLRGGMFARMDLSLRLRDSALVIPEPALVNSGDNVSVFVIDSNQRAEARPIRVGLRLAGKAEVTQGLSAGEKVIVEGVQKLAPGTPVKLAPAAAAAAYQGQ
ncbi:MAG: efflux RND transporter periplasmic adaptor subunit [Verrucomicrobia bacterium]|nr:efflux RND transporter periplasmic adaptor subunit [Verrucomicrobiota bacterium]MBI3871086.1 efflux RND transporter periplasmic adaptor subunit [Verrucomicrobiota bacterium]